jgi:hypothetical protein
LLLERFFGFKGVYLSDKAGMSRDEAEHSQSYILWFSGGKHFLNHFGVGITPVRMQNYGVDSEADTVAILLAASGGIDSFNEIGGIQLVLPDYFGVIGAPGDDCLAIWFDGKQIADISERIEHFTHIETGFVQLAFGEFGDLSEHCVIVNVDFYEGVVFAIDQRQITVCAAIRAAVGNWDEFVIRPTANMRTEFPVETIDERRCLANHQDFFTFNKGLTDRAFGRQRVSLVVDDFDRRGGEQGRYALGLGSIGDFSPEQNSIRRPGLGGIQN